jgi:hypothetical protein
MAYKPSPRPVFDKPSHIPYAGVTRHLWGEEDAGLVDVATPDFFRSRVVSPSVGRLALRGGAGQPAARSRALGHSVGVPARFVVATPRRRSGHFKELTSIALCGERSREDGRPFGRQSK